MAVHLSQFTGAQLDTLLAHLNALNPSHDNTYHTGSASRGGALGVGGIDSSKVLLSEHRGVCLQEFSINGQQLQVTGFRDVDMWTLLTTTPASNSYSNRTLLIKSGAGAITAARAVVPYTHAINSKLLEATFGYSGHVNGEGGTRRNFLGFASSFAAFPDIQRVGFSRDNTNDISYIVYGGLTGLSVRVDTLPIGRNLQATDILTVRLETTEAGSSINIARFYVNGVKQFETTSIPTIPVYVGCGVYNIDAAVTVDSEMSINYFGFKRMV